MNVLHAARRRASQLLGAQLQTAYQRRLVSGRCWSLSPALWNRTPWRIRRWLDDQVFTPCDEQSQQFLDQDPELKTLELPPGNGWSLSSSSLVAIAQLLREQAPRRMIEFGCGLSTAVLADYAARRGSTGGSADGSPTVFSVEHDLHWLEITKARLRGLGLLHHVRFIHAPLTVQSFFGDRETAYTFPDDLLQEFADGFDFCLIDGPPAQVGRFGCLPLAAPHLNPGAAILLDDSFRKGEQAVWRRWQTHFGDSLSPPQLLLTSRGMMSARWTGAFAAQLKLHSPAAAALPSRNDAESLTSSAF